MEEMLDIVDDNDRKISVGPKSVVHSSGAWHRCSDVWIIDGSRVLLQKRSDCKPIMPGRFDVSCGGHAAVNEIPIATALRELKEELGLDVPAGSLRLLEKRKQILAEREKNLVCKSVVSVFLLPISLDLKKLRFDKAEISDIRFFDLDELEYLLNHKPKMFVDNVEYIMDMVFKIRKFLKNQPK